MELGLAGVDGREVLLDDRSSRPLARPHRGGDLERRVIGCLAQHRRHAEHAVFGGGRLGQHRVADAGVAHDVVADDVGQRVRVRGGRHVGQVERLDVGGVLEDRRQLRGERVELLVGQLEPSQLGDVRHLIPRDRSHERTIVGARLRRSDNPISPSGSRHIWMRLGPSGSGSSPVSTKPWRR